MGILCCRARVVTITGNYAASSSDGVILVNNGANITVTLPTAVGLKGKRIVVIKISDNAYTVTIDGYSSEEVNDQGSYKLFDYLAAISLISDNTQWFADGSYGQAETLYTRADSHLEGTLNVYEKTVLPRDYTGRETGTSGQNITANSQSIAPSQTHRKITTSTTNKLLTSTPSIDAGTEGQLLLLTCGVADTRYVGIQDGATLSNSGVLLKSSVRRILPYGHLLLMYVGSKWVELSYSPGSSYSQSGLIGNLSVENFTGLTGPLGFGSDSQSITSVGDQIDPDQASVVVVSSGDGNDYTLTSQPTIPNSSGAPFSFATCLLILVGGAGPGAITLQDEGSLSGSNLHLGAASRELNSLTTLVLLRTADNYWVELAYSVNTPA